MTFDWILPGDRFLLLAQTGIILVAAAAAVALLKPRILNPYNGRLIITALSPLLLADLLLSFVFLIKVMAFISMPVALNNNEGGLMTHVVEALDGTTYPEFGKIPYEINNYGPVFFYLAAAIVQIFDTEILAAMRALTAIATMGCAVLAGAMIFLALPGRLPHSERSMAALFGGLTVLTSAITLRSIGRLDSVAVFFSLVGMLSIIGGAKSPSWFVVAILAFATSVFTKQTALAGWTASTLVLFYVAPRWGIKFALAAIAVIAVAFASLQIATNGNFFTHTLWANASQPFDASILLAKEREFLSSYALGAGVAIFGCVMAFGSAAAGSSRAADLRRLLPMAYGVAAMLSTITAGKAGTGINHFFEPNVALAILTAIGIGYAADYIGRNWDRRQSMRKIAGVAVLALTLVQAWILLGKHSDNAVTTFLRRSNEEIAVAAEVVRWVENAEGPVIAADRSYLVLAKKPVFYELNDMRLLAVAGKFADKPIIDCLRSGPCGLLVLEKRTHQLVQSIAPGETAVRNGAMNAEITAVLASHMSVEMASIIASRFGLVWSSPKVFIYARIPVVDPQ